LISSANTLLNRPMPADHRLRLHDRESVQHAGRQLIQPGKYQTVDAGENWRFTPQHVDLMAKRQDLYLQRRSRSEQSDQRQPNQAKSISHEPRASPDSTALTSRIEFPTMTGWLDLPRGGLAPPILCQRTGALCCGRNPE